MPVDIDLSGQAALVTGGTRGIGLAIARALLEAGAHVAVVGRKPDGLQAAAGTLAAFGDRLLAVRGNVGDAEDRRRVIDEVATKFGGLSILVNNAAANPVYGKVEDTEAWAFDKIMSVNVSAPFELAKLALPYLTARDRSYVVNISSIGGLRPEPGLGIYSVSKAALNSLTKVMAREWGPRGVHVNGVCPGLIKTDFSQALWDNDKTAAHLVRNTPLQRIGDPEDIGAVVLALVGPAGAYMSGHILTADGGYTV